jgi:hypothetical protein
MKRGPRLVHRASPPLAAIPDDPNPPKCMPGDKIYELVSRKASSGGAVATCGSCEAAGVAPHPSEHPSPRRRPPPVSMAMRKTWPLTACSRIGTLTRHTMTPGLIGRAPDGRDPVLAISQAGGLCDGLSPGAASRASKHRSGCARRESHSRFWPPLTCRHPGIGRGYLHRRFRRQPRRPGGHRRRRPARSRPELGQTATVSGCRSGTSGQVRLRL